MKVYIKPELKFVTLMAEEKFAGSCITIHTPTEGLPYPECGYCGHRTN